VLRRETRMAVLHCGRVTAQLPTKMPTAWQYHNMCYGTVGPRAIGHLPVSRPNHHAISGKPTLLQNSRGTLETMINSLSSHLTYTTWRPVSCMGRQRWPQPDVRVRFDTMGYRMITGFEGAGSRYAYRSPRVGFIGLPGVGSILDEPHM
jgi:hypothetical protein